MSSHVTNLPGFQKDRTNLPEEGYERFEKLVAERVELNKEPVFMTNAQGLFSIFLKGLPENRRQHYTCNCCARFIERYGGLVILSASGTMEPLLWSKSAPFDDRVPEFFHKSVYDMCVTIMRAKVTGVFISPDAMWGTPESGGWTHLHGKNLNVYSTDKLLTAEQMMALKREDYKLLRLSVQEYLPQHVDQAVRVLKADALDGSERALGVAQWLQNLYKHLRIAGKGPAYSNVLWYAAATAPVGFCHINSTMIGTLLEDVKKGLLYETLRRRWNEKMSPTKYRRTESISDSNVDNAENIITKLGCAESFKRRFAKLDDVQQFLWVPEKVAAQTPSGGDASEGLFGHLKKSRRTPVEMLRLPAKKITLEKFLQTVLTPENGVVKLSLQVPSGRHPWSALTTAVNPDAPPILKWDGVERETVDGYTKDQYPGLPEAFRLPRNPVAWYMYDEGSYAARWGLLASTWVEVVGICSSPAHWQRPDLFDFCHKIAFFLVKDCRDGEYRKGGLFFTSELKSEFHQIRKTLEAFSNNSVLEGKDDATACGLALIRGADMGYCVRVETAEGEQTYIIDRWE